ncbi:MAG TPA: 3-hydroxyacyl-CoA dehydrogenase NAD-binding domain-containing protein [Pyrinomonadaceae bacterium]|nr:3-hydroxyacyl-CoA dehydrogenase NAD-binding domain-containing protein [Pyrinomonadaceae bacterium]
MRVQTVGVIGAGVMGVGVAQGLAQTGHRVIVVDLSEGILDRARGELRNNLRLQNLFRKGGAKESPAEAAERVRFTLDYAELGAAEFVVENATEKWEVKREVYARLEEVCAPACVFAANTSAIPITRIASATRRAPQVVGMHFMNPVPLKPVVEVIRGYHTSPETLEAARALLAAMGKEAVVVNDSPGFVSNRVLMLTVNEAVYLLHEGVASAEDVDKIFKTCFGHKMGPLETADLIGLDTILLSLEVLYESFSDSKYRPCPLLRKMVDAGLHGRKSGRGFYAY